MLRGIIRSEAEMSESYAGLFKPLYHGSDVIVSEPDAAYGAPETSMAKETAIRLLLTQKLYNQVFFGTERAVSRLLYLEHYDVCIK
jgi:hypothetical protein